MNRRLQWTLSRPIDGILDVDSVRHENVIALPVDAILCRRIFWNDQPAAIGDWFDIDDLPGESALASGQIDWRGDLQNVCHLGHEHSTGLWTLHGDVGDHCGSCMTGGRIVVYGNVGDHAAGATGSRGVGMNGGVLDVRGDAGHFAGHRMRRGELRIDGHAGDSLATLMVAGTIFCGGNVGRNFAAGMRRGTVILGTPNELADDRFTPPRPLRTVFQSLLSHRADLTERFGRVLSGGLTVSRGDRFLNGRGEVWMTDDVER